MTNSFDPIQTVVIFDAMKDAIGILLGGLFVGLGLSVSVVGLKTIADGVKLMIQILK
jgi:hypothetical protein